MPTDDTSTAPSYLYSPGIIETAAFSMADAFVQRVHRFRPEDRVTLVKLVRKRIESKDPQIAKLLSSPR